MATNISYYSQFNNESPIALSGEALTRQTEKLQNQKLRSVYAMSEALRISFGDGDSVEIE